MAQNMMPGLEQSLLQLQWSVNAIQVSLERLQESQRNSQLDNGRHVRVLTQVVMDIKRRIAAPQQALPQPRQPRIPGANTVVQRRPSIPKANPAVQRRCVSSSQTHQAAKTLRAKTTPENISVRLTNRRTISETLTGVMDIPLFPLLNMRAYGPSLANWALMILR
ncbi:unnamed protein product [Clonostachys rhizophaga]|uniref:Uncharacterized protein n=1 Tax=Clonostachys rhizophaga TaxID=160324 RepID=A0A9N9VBL3_9HYPO|nr:unnamed protein product [Clonostachys rhizophaga]